MAVHILTDSSHYLDPATIEALKIHVLPLTLHLAGQDRRERLDITTEELFQVLADRSAGWPTTAAVSPAALLKAYDALTQDGDEVAGILTTEYDIKEIELLISFSASGKFLGIGAGGAASIKIKIAPV